MEFICCNCGKPLTSIAFILDKTHFLHEECKEEYIESLLESELDKELEETE
jgi:hypothetical protein